MENATMTNGILRIYQNKLSCNFVERWTKSNKLFYGMKNIKFVTLKLKEINTLYSFGDMYTYYQFQYLTKDRQSKCFNIYKKDVEKIIKTDNRYFKVILSKDVKIKKYNLKIPNKKNIQFFD